jgi:hypothetical protein
MEMAARRRMHWARDISFEDNPLLGDVRIWDGNRRKKGNRIGMER